jgi:polysaccharide pyruvyl transferase CsaB
MVILGGDADGNLGDRAILQAMCREILALAPDARITVVSAAPERAVRDYGAAVVAPGWRGLLALCMAAARADLVICGGGGLFQDDDSLVKMPYWAVRAAAMRLLCRRVVGYALGVGPLRAGTSKLAARLAFACMQRVTVRDPEALAIAQTLTMKPVAVVPDPAILLPPADAAVAVAALRDQGVPLDGRPLIGVAVRRWFPSRPRIVPNHIAVRLPWHRERPDPDAQQLTTLLAQALDQLVQLHDAHVLFLPTYTCSHEADDRISLEIMGKMASRSCQLVTVDDPALYKAITGRLAVLLGGRMHPTILAAAMGTPVVGLAYNQKFFGFFDLIDAGNRVLDVVDFVRREHVAGLVGMLEAAIREQPRALRRVEALGARVRDFNRSLLEGLT